LGKLNFFTDDQLYRGFTKGELKMPEEGNYGYSRGSRYVTKKCPECFTYLPLNTEKCPSCGTKLGDVNKLGFASRPFDWSGYLIAILSILGLGLFVWWGFFSD
jgi:RNA polymerase subunit RPABC4/transcription elongation factor Spt4